MSDFQTADINELLTGKPEPVKEADFNEVLDRYDKELMSFAKTVSHKQTWPTPIRKRRCIK